VAQADSLRTAAFQAALKYYYILIPLHAATIGGTGGFACHRRILAGVLAASPLPKLGRPIALTRPFAACIRKRTSVKRGCSSLPLGNES
jgi:hypothetical protein